MKRRLTIFGAAVLVVAASFVVYAQEASAAVGLHTSGRNIVEANGQQFIMRGVNHPHVWYTGNTQAFADVKALGANTVRVVLGSGKRWGPSNDVANVISLCKANKLICVLEVHDTTGYGEDGAAATLDEAVNYWISQKSVLVGQESYISINIGNEPIGNNNPSQWTAATVAAIQKMRSNGFQHLLMVDAPNWGQDWQNVMRDNAQQVYDADTLKNTVLSIHMYAVYANAQTIIDYLDRFQNNNWPLVIGEFGWQFQSGEVDHETLLAQADARGLGYIGWSWSGNTDPVLDMATNFNPSQLTTWGQRIFNGAHGIKATAKEASIYGGAASPSPSRSSVSASPSRSASTSASPSRSSASPSRSVSGSASPGGGRSCTAVYSVVGQWPGGFQGQVTVTAGGQAVSGWTVKWTYAGGQTVTSFWSADVTSSGANVTATNVGYNGTIGAGQSTSFGFLGASGSTNPVPTATCTAV
ncbi:cellulase family glycosylhydrolase [Dactylosporangium vinaceum]|uniref:Endoglucanase n=1 Tax=Dactylosporangium vinaceum TaxID=53362 RepID=A0ABV5MKE3_9ACTN|nr:cellulase family glycosylhydrolase [Dactylosporangium vinaceum]UAB94120.1 cellulase family glycosylhydrolase [Dactylosporangium vinaceum]